VIANERYEGNYGGSFSITLVVWASSEHCCSLGGMKTACTMERICDAAQENEILKNVL